MCMDEEDEDEEDQQEYDDHMPSDVNNIKHKFKLKIGGIGKGVTSTSYGNKFLDLRKTF